MFSRDFRQIALSALKGKWGLAILTGLVATLLMGSDGYNINFSVPAQINPSSMGAVFYMMLPFLTVASLFSIAIFIVGGVTEIGYKKFNLNLIRNENPDFNTLFSYYKVIPKGIAFSIVRTLFITLWSLLFFVPGIVAAYRYALMPYILADNPDMEVMEAMNKSKQMMKGNKFRLFSLHFSFIGWVILATLTFGIGFLWPNPYMNVSEAVFYERLKFESNASYNTYKEPDFDTVNWNE